MGFVKEKDFFLFCLVYHSILILCIKKKKILWDELKFILLFWAYEVFYVQKNTFTF